VLDWRVVEKEEPNSMSDDISLEDTRPALKNEGKTKNRKEKMKIFVVAIHKNAIERYRDIIRNAKLGLEFLEIEIFSTIRSVVEHNTGTVVVLDIGSGVTKLYIVEYGVVKRSHLISRGSQDISSAISRTLGITVPKAEEKKREIGLLGEGEDKEVSEIILTNLKYIFEETSKVLTKYQSECHKDISEVIFTGGGSVIKGLTDTATKNLKMESVVADPFSKIKTPAFLDDILKEIGPEFAVAVGLALRGLEK